MVIDRGRDDFLYSPFGDCIIWPPNPTFYPSVTTSDLTTWGDVTLGTPPPPSGHVIDGVIDAGEYDGGTAVTLVGRTDPNWTVDGYIDWDNEYLYVAVNEPVPPGTGTQSWIEFCFDAGPSRSYLDAFALFCSGQKQHVQCPKPPGSWGWVPYDFLATTGTATEFKVKYTDFGISLGDTIKMSIDRNHGPPPPEPYGFAAFWPQNADVYDGSPDPTTWGDVYLSPQAPPTQYELTVNSTPISGISYTVDSQSALTGTSITLNNGSHTVTMPSSITVGADFYTFAHWEDSSTNPVRTIDLQSNTVLMAAYTKAGHVVNGVIGSGEYDGGMAITLIGRWDPGWTVDAYIDWDDQYLYVAVNEHVPPTTGHISWIEFAIDAGPARPYLDAFVIFDDHVQSYVRYTKPSGPWGSQGVGTFLVVSGIATEFRVKYTDYGISLGDTIKMAIDRNLGPSPPPPYGQAAFWPQNAIVYYGTPQAQPTTWGDVTLSAPTTYEMTVNSSPVSGIAYTVDSQPAVTGIPITLDSGSHTITMPPITISGADIYNFAHWEDSSTNPVRTIDLQSNTVLTATYTMASHPDLEFVLVNPDPGKPFEFCKIFEVEVYATHISAHLTDYDLKIVYNPQLIKFVDVDVWGFFGAGHVDNSTLGVVRVWQDPPSTNPYVGEKTLLFTLTFHIEFDDSIGHIWRTSNQGPLPAQISLDTTFGKLSFQEGDIPINQIIPPSPVTVTVNLIQGDVAYLGKVDIDDLRTVAAFYDQAAGPGSPAEKYDLKTDGTIDIFDLVIVAAKFGYNT
jgi:hypothetical protein